MEFRDSLPVVGPLTNHYFYEAKRLTYSSRLPFAKANGNEKSFVGVDTFVIYLFCFVVVMVLNRDFSDGWIERIKTFKRKNPEPFVQL